MTNNGPLEHKLGVNLSLLYTLIRDQTPRICEPLEMEDYGVQPAPFVSPPKWHLAHTTWFFEHFVLSRFLPGYRHFNEYFGRLFNSYYKTIGEHWLQHKRGILSRPTIREIQAYRKAIDERMLELLATRLSEEQKALVTVGLHHEQQHQELLYMDIKYILSLNNADASYCALSSQRAMPHPESWHYFAEGLYGVGHDELSFAFDNEKPCHQVYLYPFMISDTLVSNGDFLAFVDSGAYGEPQYWLSLGWDWLNKQGVQYPLYWRRINQRWFEYTLYGLEELDLAAPLSHISYFEADAYARWQKARLPTEFEYEIYLKSSKEIDKSLSLLHPRSTRATRAQVWCWTSSAYSAYPRFKAFEHGLGEYNGKFMCNQMVLRGASVATPAGHFRDSYRNFFLPHQRWMFSGLRLAKDMP